MTKKHMFRLLIAPILLLAHQGLLGGKIFLNRETCLPVSPSAYIAGYSLPFQRASDNGLIAACMEMIRYEYKDGSAGFYIEGMSIFQDKVYPICKSMEAEINSVYRLMENAIELIECSTSTIGYSDGIEKIFSMIKALHLEVKEILAEVNVQSRLITCTREIERIRRLEKTKTTCKKLLKIVDLCSKMESSKKEFLRALEETHPLIVEAFCQHRNNHLDCTYGTENPNICALKSPQQKPCKLANKTTCLLLAAVITGACTVLIYNLLK